MADLLELLLNRLNLTTQVFHTGSHCGEWNLQLEASDKALFHFIAEGTCIMKFAYEPKTLCCMKVIKSCFRRLKTIVFGQAIRIVIMRIQAD